jgi:hypothetical protein
VLEGEIVGGIDTKTLQKDFLMPLAPLRALTRGFGIDLVAKMFSKISISIMLRQVEGPR